MEKAERKRQLRRQCFAAIRQMDDLEKAIASKSICAQLSELNCYQNARTIFSFLPLPSEPDLTSLFSASKTWAFSRVLANDTMEFRQMKNLGDATEGDYKIREPNPQNCPLISAAKAELILIPGVGFDAATGNRLGRGKGHYDRYLSGILEQSKPPKLVGICFSVQLCEVEAELHDIPMDLVIYDQTRS